MVARVPRPALGIFDDAGEHVPPLFTHDNQLADLLNGNAMFPSPVNERQAPLVLDEAAFKFGVQTALCAKRLLRTHETMARPT